MIKTSQLLEQLGRTFGKGVECEVATHLLDFLTQHKEANHITLQLVRQLIPSGNSGKFDSEIVRTLQYLAGDAIRILDTKFELINDNESQTILTEEEVGYILSDQINPITGEIDPEIRNKVVVFFCPSKYYRRTELFNDLVQKGGA